MLRWALSLFGKLRLNANSSITSQAIHLFSNTTHPCRKLSCVSGRTVWPHITFYAFLPLVVSLLPESGGGFDFLYGVNRFWLFLCFSDTRPTAASLAVATQEACQVVMWCVWSHLQWKVTTSSVLRRHYHCLFSMVAVGSKYVELLQEADTGMCTQV